MKTLYLLRHAKSSWNNPNLNDFDRPLNKRGLKAAPFMGEVMLKKNIAPELIVSSPAERARQTAALVKEAAQISGDLEFDDLIYGASAPELLRVVAGLDNKFRTAMLVGHNPGFEYTVKILSGVYERMPTAALAIIDLDITDWSNVSPECGTLQDVLRPKEIF